MTHGSLFSGIGGFDLAAKWVGWQNVFHCESNKFGQQVLKYHFPNSILYENIKTTDFTIHKGRIDVISGGFPCQPYSSAGKRLGKEDERHLWPEMLRTIKEIQPRWVVGENVRGLTNWNGGMVFDEVQFDLETQGYEVIPFLLPACAVNAPHRRDRIWFIAYSNSNGLHKCNSKNEKHTSKRRKYAQCNTKQDDVKNTNSIRQKYKMENKELEGKRAWKSNKRNVWDTFPSKPAICGRNDGIPKELDGITISKWIKESLKAYGNAIVPQVAYEIFKSINFYETSF